jgi:hypothetical protein
MLLSKEQVAELTEEQCEKHLKLLAKTYALEKPITAELWPQVDDIANTLLWLEDRIRALDISEKLTNANNARWGKT